MKDQTTAERRAALLERIWLAGAEKIAEILETTPAEKLQAATLNVARQFLGDNNISTESLEAKRRSATATQRLLEDVVAAERSQDRDQDPRTIPELPTPDWGHADRLPLADNGGD